MYCRNCGKEVTPNAEICMGCGARPMAGKSYCHNCGSQTSELAEICVKCGVRLVAAVSPQAPALLPGVISAYKYAWKALWPSFWILFLIGLVVAVIGNVFSGFDFAFPKSNILPLLSGVFAVFVSIPLQYGQSYCYLQVAKNSKVEFEEVFTGFKLYWNTIGAGILTGLIIAGGCILLIVPGIIFSCKLAFVPYLVTDRKLGPVEAIKTSWKMTKGHAMEVFLIELLAIPVMIAGLICLLVGVVVSAMWISMSMASLYYAVDAQTGQSGQPTQVLPS